MSFPDPMREFFKIIALTIVAAIVYDILHDQITARICIEYFTIAHPPVFGDTQSPTLLAFGWGIIATWWVGLLLGTPLAVCARVGALPKLTARQLFKPICLILCILFALAMVAAAVGYMCAQRKLIHLPEPLASEVAPDRHSLLLADACAHLASYGFGAILGVTLWIHTLLARYRRATKRAV
jgi:hypothetical protein